MQRSTVLTLLPLAIVLLIVAWMVIKFRRDAASAVPGPDGLTPYGVHGWLRFFIFASYYLSPLFGAGRLSNEFRMAEERAPQLLSLDGWTRYKAASWLLLVGMIVWQWWVAYGLKNRLEPRSVFHVKVLLCAAPPLMYLLDLVLGKTLLRLHVTAEAVGAVIGAFIATALISLVWFLYFTRSMRVHNTYSLPLSRKKSVDRKTTKEKREEESPLEPGQFNVPTTSIPTESTTQIDTLSPGSAAEAPSIEVRLETLKRMLDRGLITRDDFESKKSQLLRSL
jgi:hypothetical protein